MAQKWKYNGKELQEDLGLNMYDYGARFYDPAVGRWFTIDALAEKYYDQSVYTYTLNNPILYVDPDGNQVEMCCEKLLGLLNAAKNKVVDTVKDIASNPLGETGGGVFSGVSLAKGDYQGALENEPTGVYQTAVETKKAVNGDTDAQGGLLVSAFSALVLKKVVKTGGNKKFNGKNDTKSVTSKEALRNAKDQNGIPRSQQPDKTIKSGTPDGDAAGLDSRNVK